MKEGQVDPFQAIVFQQTNLRFVCHFPYPLMLLPTLYHITGLSDRLLLDYKRHVRQVAAIESSREPGLAVQPPSSSPPNRSTWSMPTEAMAWLHRADGLLAGTWFVQVLALRVIDQVSPSSSETSHRQTGVPGPRRGRPWHGHIARTGWRRVPGSSRCWRSGHRPRYHYC